MMNRLTKMFTASGTLLCVPLLPLTLPDVHNYLDPGTGSLIIQVLIATFLGGLFLTKVYWGKVTAFLSKLFRRARRGDD